MHTNSIVTLDRIAVDTSVELVARSTTADLALPTPCAGWALRDLLAHMTTQHHGFAAAATGETSLDAWRPRSLGEDHVGNYRAAAAKVVQAFAAAGVIDRGFTLPEFGTDTPFRGRTAIGFHFIDYVVHSWDVAETLGVPVHFDADLLDVAMSITRAVPGGDRRLAPGAAFGPEVAPAGESTMDLIVAMLGRRPLERSGPHEHTPSRRFVHKLL
jgi:uncharacterized protein (TIGR03086 family)